MDYAKAISVEELEKAAFECAKGVRWKESVAKWMFCREQNVLKLHEDLVKGRYKLQDYIIFFLNDPKQRIIHSTRFRDRVVQRSLCNNGLYEALTKPLIYDCGACLNGKGTMFTAKRLIAHMQKYYREQCKSNVGWYLKLDIKKYFDSTPHGRLKELVAKVVKEPNFLKHVYRIIDSFEDSREYMKLEDLPYEKVPIEEDPFGRRGIGLGSQISQILQLLYLSELDHMIKEKYKIKHYVRYMDDMILFHPDKEYLQRIWREVEDYLRTIGLRLNPKSRLGRIEQGFVFMKIRMTLTKTGKVKKKFSRKSLAREMRRINTLMRKLKEGILEPRDIVQHFNTWFGSNRYKLAPHQPRIIRNHVKSAFAKILAEQEAEQQEELKAREAQLEDEERIDAMLSLASEEALEETTEECEDIPSE